MRHLLHSCFPFLLLSATLHDAQDGRRAVHAAVVDPAVEQALALAEDTYVVVSLRPVQPRGLEAQAIQMQAVRDRQELVLAGLSEEEFRLVYRYRTFAAMSGHLDRDGLQVLRRHSDVLSITADARGQMVLDSSGAAIGADLLQRFGVTGEGITVAVLDGGIDTDHPDLQDDIAPGAWHFLGQGTDVGPGAEDVGGHGTAVSGVITSAGIVAPLGIAPDAQVLPVQVVQPTGGWLSDWAAGVDYVVSVAGNYANLAVINMSLGSALLYSECPCDAQTPILAAATAAAEAAGIAVVASSGNEGSCGSMASPACLSSVLSVGAAYDADYGREPDIGNYVLAPCSDATTAPNQVVCFSNRNDCLDVVGPGRYVQTSEIGGGTNSFTGTSFASPQVAGVYALLSEIAAFTPDDFLGLVASTGHVTSDSGCVMPAGLPRVDAQSMLCALAPEYASSTVRGLSKLSATRGGFTGGLADGDEFGTSVCSLGDLDGDGFLDLAVGAPGDDTGGLDRGAVWILFLDRYGRSREEVRIAEGEGGFLGALADADGFGAALAHAGDLDGDGTVELVVGAPGDDLAGPERGAIWILSLRSDGTVAAESHVTDGTAGIGLFDGDAFGTSVAQLTDLDANGTRELIVGAPESDDGGADRGAVWVLFLDGTVVVGSQAVSATQGTFAGILEDGDAFGRAVASLGDLGSDGVPEVAVGAFEDDDVGVDEGSVWILSMDASGQVVGEQRIGATAGGFAGPLDSGDRFGSALAAADDLDGDGVADLLVGAVVDDEGGRDRGAVWVLFLEADGTVKSEDKLGSAQCILATELEDEDRFGRAVAYLRGPGRLLPDLAIGAFRDDDGGSDRGAVWLTGLLGGGVRSNGTPAPFVAR